MAAIALLLAAACLPGCRTAPTSQALAPAQAGAKTAQAQSAAAPAASASAAHASKPASSTYRPAHSRQVALQVPKGAATAGRLTWSPDGRRIVCSVTYQNPDTAGKLGRRLALVDPATGRLTFLTKGYYDRSPAWSPNGKWIAFLRGTRPTAADLRAMQAYDAAFREAVQRRASGKKPTAGELKSLMPSAAVQKQARAAAIQTACGELYEIAATGGPARKLAGHGKTASLGQPTWSPKGGKVAYAKFLETGSHNQNAVVVIAENAAGRPTATSQIPVSESVWVSTLAWSPAGTALAAAGNTTTIIASERKANFSQGVYLFDLARKRRTVLVQRKNVTPGEAESSIPPSQRVVWNSKGSAVIFLTALSEEALHFSAVDVKTGAVKPYLAATLPSGYRLASRGTWNPARTVLAVAATPTSGSGGAVLLYYRGGAKASMLRTKTPVTTVSWSRDGKKLRLAHARYFEIMDAPEGRTLP